MEKIRRARPEDSTPLLEIYRPHVENSFVSFETVMPSREEFEKRLMENAQFFPWLVMEKENRIAGYAYAAPFRARAAYVWSVESTVYVHPDFQKMGVGKKLYEALLAQLKEQGVVNVLAGIALPNPASVALHEKMGFAPVANFKDIGFKNGEWRDVGFWQLQLQRPENPDPLAPARP